MAEDRSVTVGGDVHGSLIVPGDNNQVFLILNAEKLSSETLAGLRSGRLHPQEIEDAIPLPALTLALAFTDQTRQQWTVEARRPVGDPVRRVTRAPWGATPAFLPALDTFWRLSRQAVETEDEAEQLDRQARLLGESLAGVLTTEEWDLLESAARGDPPPPLLIIESEDDLILALPWELLCVGHAFIVEGGRLDVARSVPAKGSPELERPAAPVTLLVNLSAPEGSGLNSEAESYFITRALHDHVGVVVNEMGEVDDLIGGLCRDPYPIGVHFSGHGGPGVLEFEDEIGDAVSVPVKDLLTRLRQAAPKRLPRFFYLACCHGGDAPSLKDDGGPAESGIAAAASELHREGVTQVVAYFGPVYDRVSTWAEKAFYAEIAAGRLTRDGVRAARREMIRSPQGERALRRDAAGWAGAATLPFGWAQMVLYHRGPDHPLGLPLQAGPQPLAVETTQRELAPAFIGSRTEVLRKGFVGRRRELHRLRRDLKQGRHIHVVQGLGGVGKSAFCTEALKMYATQGWQPLALWCADVEGKPDPASDLLEQLKQTGRALAGEVWDQALAMIDQAAADHRELQQPAARLVALVSLALEMTRRPLVLALDNLESLLVGPDTDDPDALGVWRDDEAAALWRGLRDLAEKQPGRLALLASCRYRHADFQGVVVPFRRLPDDATFRMMGWFAGLRRLSDRSLHRLVEHVSGHPRSVEFIDALVRHRIGVWEDRNGPLQPGRLSADDEWTALVAPALPDLQDRLSDDLLFERLWARVLNPPARDLLMRATVLRRPVSRDLLAALHGDPATADAPIDRLRNASLLTEVEVHLPDGTLARRFEVPPAVARLAAGLSAHAAALREEGHLRAGAHLEAAAFNSNDIFARIDGAWHLDQAGETDRAFDLLHPLAYALSKRSQVFDSLGLFRQLQDPEVLEPRRRGILHDFEGEAWVAQGYLDEALTAYRAAHTIFERLAAADPTKAGWQRDVAVSQEKVGNVLFDQRRLDEALAAYHASLVIAERLAAADPTNAGWQRDLAMSQDRIGDVLFDQGRLDDALIAYRASFAIREPRAAADPSHAGWHYDLSVSQIKIGDVLFDQERLDDALIAYRASLAIREPRAAADPSHAGWQRDLFVSQTKLGRIEEKHDALGKALRHYRDAEVIMRKLTVLDPTNAQWRQDMAWVKERIDGLASV